jgi:hypothetical protein
MCLGYVVFVMSDFESVIEYKTFVWFSFCSNSAYKYVLCQTNPQKSLFFWNVLIVNLSYHSK